MLQNSKLSPDSIELLKSRLEQLEMSYSVEDIPVREIIGKAILTASNSMQDHYLHLESSYITLKNKCDLLIKEREQCNNFYMIQDSAKSKKLENLCRELQKDNKSVREEALKASKEAEKKRDELSSKFESAISDIKEKIEKDSEEQKKRQGMYEKMKEQYNNYVEQYDLREKHFNTLMKKKDLELKLAEAKLQQQIQNNSEMNSQVETLTRQVTEYSFIEKEMKAQICTYAEKFKSVEVMLDKSNVMFDTLKKEIDNMNKKNRSLEIEKQNQSRKIETFNKNILEMIDERTKMQSSIDNLKTQNQKLEKLCRALQQERKKAKEELKQIDENAKSSDSGKSEIENLDDSEKVTE
ncbi:Taxilin family domain-containing protein [Rozella allomycis CSF55]|uniref:Taxilin family domain-containing protein n=1 Tax=Rozella allomycis (strain CSF55) TaxID=988480 RepID=A0A075B4Z4_ROZAC|nr:Taxilin family domain-containing protein [Rozella allomycis CSF55]|eukprot:EPZ36791.1 Taxilin family domain-containing protein [Rozella allomycis CSF55]